MSFRAEWDQLLLAARGGDALALGQLLESAQADLMAASASVLSRTQRTRLSADDLFGDALLAALRDLGALRATNYLGFRYWFASIARNHLRRALRHERVRRTQAQGDLDPAEDAPAAPQAAGESLDFVRSVLPRLTPGQQLAYVLREGLGLSWRTIGFVLQRRGPAAARLSHYRAAQRIRELAETRPFLRRGAPAILS